VPCPRRDGELLPWSERPFLAVDQEGDEAAQRLEMFRTVVVTVLATGDEGAFIDCELGYDPRAASLLGGLD